jgi:3-mercaptopyruvate sulfurtransferase SseA
MPYALNVSADVFKGNLADPAKLAPILGPAGVNSKDEAVIVSSGGLTESSALAFLVLEKLGQKVSVLMESMDDWGLGGYTLTKDPTVVGPPKSPQDIAVPPGVYAPNVKSGVVIRDARAGGGPYPKVIVVSGKGEPAKLTDGKVVHVPYTDLLDDKGMPKPAAEIWKVLVKAGVPRYAEIVLVSDDPGEAAINYYIFRLMGFPDVKVLVS